MEFAECAGLGMPMGQALVVGSVFVFGETAYGEQLKYKDVDCETHPGRGRSGVVLRNYGLGADGLRAREMQVPMLLRCKAVDHGNKASWKAEGYRTHTGISSSKCFS